MARRVVSVIGGTGAQGGGVVNALLAQGEFSVRVASRNPSSDAARALAARGVEVVKGDLLDPGSLGAVFEGAHGAFVVTNFWDPDVGARETEVGTAAVKAARAAGVEHLVWSTLPDCEKISGGSNHVEHFTAKARVDDAVRGAGFARHTFVQPPMYYQNFSTMMGPQPLPTGGRGWAVPMDPALRVMHMGDAAEVGRAVSAALSAGDRLADGSYLAVCGGIYSWNDVIAILNGQGHKLEVMRVPAAAYDGFYPGAREMREMFDYFSAHTYFGPQAEPRIAAANKLVPGGFTGFAEWARVNMKPA
jgi:uncharacterized protein YbjT (DUF2867 family)